MEETKTITFKSEDKESNMIIEGKITGSSQIKFHDDMKLEAVLALLNSVDKRNFGESEKLELFHTYIQEIEETLLAMKTFDSFQGDIYQ